MDKLKTEIFVVCDYAMVSREQKLSIIDIFDHFSVKKVPFIWPRMVYVIAVLTGGVGIINEKYNLKLSVVTPTGKLESLGKDINIKAGLGGANFICELADFSLPEFGLYKIILSYERKVIGSLDLQVYKLIKDKNVQKNSHKHK